MKEVTILLPVFNRLEFTKICLNNLETAIRDQRIIHSKYTIVVIDDGSTDGTSEWLKRHHSHIVMLSGDGNLWWSGSINLGAQYAIEELQSDLIVLWNNDIVAAEDYFLQLDQMIGRLDDRTIVGSKIYYSGDEGTIWSMGGIFDPRTGKKYMVGYNQHDSQYYEEVKEVDWLPGMGTLLPARVIRDIGYWDAENFPQYHGDSDFTYRAKKAGYRILTYPSLKIWNDKSSSGITHGGTLRGLIKSMNSIRSNTNLSKNLLFYRRHCVSALAYLPLIGYYFRVYGGFVKWKFLSLFRVGRNH